MRGADPILAHQQFEDDHYLRLADGGGFFAVPACEMSSGTQIFNIPGWCWVFFQKVFAYLIISLKLTINITTNYGRSTKGTRRKTEFISHRNLPALAPRPRGSPETKQEQPANCGNGKGTRPTDP